MDEVRFFGRDEVEAIGWTSFRSPGNESSTPEEYERQEEEDIARRHGKYNIPEDCIFGDIVQDYYIACSESDGRGNTRTYFESVEEEMLFDTS